MRPFAILLAAVIPAVALSAPSGLAQGGQDKAREAAENKLRSMKVSLDFTNAPLDAVVEYLRELSGINIVVGAKAREKSPQVSIKVSDISLQSVLRLMLAPHGCGTLWKDGVLQILTRPEIDDLTIKMEIYECRDILYPIQNFPGVEIDIGAGAGVVVAPPDEPLPAEFPIEELVKAHTGARSWEENPRVSCRLQNGLLVVKQTPEVHRQVRRLLDLLRRNK